jgi:hypothetical protein
MNRRGFLVDHRVLTTTVRACEMGGQWQKAAHIVEKMWQDAMSPTTSAILRNVLISSPRKPVGSINISPII